MADKKTVKVTLIKSTIGRQPKHIATVKGLGNPAPTFVSNRYFTPRWRAICFSSR